MSVKLYQWLTTLLLIGVTGCYPGGVEYADELNLVYTNFNNQYDFKSKTTYAIPDSVVEITGDVFNDPDGNGKPQFLSAANSKVILDQIKKNMAGYGWTQVNKNNNPDVLLLVSAMTTTNIYYYYDWYYWNWWYGGYYGWYYPCCYYPAYVTGYRSGSVLMQLVEIKGIPNGDNIPVQWTGILNGLAEGGSSTLAPRVQSLIDKAFAQSPYLKH
jgi:hypothetical protein